MGASGGRGVQSESDYEWLDLADFSAGIYDYTRIAATNPNVPAPKGSADPNETFSCVALPGGGIGPLPKMVEDYQWPGDFVTGPNNFVVGLLVHDELANGNTEAFAVGEMDDGVNRFWQAWSYIPETTTGTLIVQQINASGSGLFGSPYPQMTRAAATAPTTTVGIPVIVFPIGGPASPPAEPTGTVFMYPDPAAPTVYGAKLLYTPGNPGVAGQVLVHQSRIIVLSGIAYSYPAGGGFDTNEQIAFTDPPNSTVLGFQQTVLATEEPFGYGAGGSISAGELVLVKKRGGAIVVTGDIFSPNVTILPGVQPTGGIYGSAHSGMPGFVYCSFDNGAWVWNGGSTAQKISNQLDDSFFLPPEFATMLSNNYGFYVRCIGDKVYFSNNWMLDLRTNGWWRYYPTKSQGGADLFYVQEVDGQQIYGGRLSFPSTDRTFLYRFDQQVPTETWQWQGLPIRLSTDRFVELRQVIVRASSNLANANGTVKVEVYNGATLVGSVTSPNGDINAAPTMLRMPIGAVSAGGSGYASEDLTIRIIADGAGGPAPNVHSVSLGWKQVAKAKTIGVAS